MVDIDIVKDNQKVKAQKGELQFFIEGKLRVDKQDFTKNFFLGAVKKILRDIWMKKSMEYHYLKILDDVQKLEVELKQQLNLFNFGSTKRPFIKEF